MRYFFVLLVTLFPMLVRAGIWYDIVQIESGLNAPATDSSYGRSINSLGEIAGSFQPAGTFAEHPFEFTLGAGMSDLGNFGGGLAFGMDINNSGQVTGWGTLENGGPSQAFRYTTAGGFQLLGTMGGLSSEARAINNSGQVTGTLTRADGTEVAFRYTDGVGMQELGIGHIGWGINDQGWVTGASGPNAFLYRDDQGATILGLGRGLAINNQGVVAGEQGYPFSSMAVVWANGETTVLGTLGGTRSMAIGINEQNQVVGGVERANGSTVGYIWSQADGMLDLNSLVVSNSGWFLGTAYDINDNGWIVGTGYKDGKSQGYLLIPVPEPATWTMFGLGALAFTVLHRRRGV